VFDGLGTVCAPPTTAPQNRQGRDAARHRHVVATDWGSMIVNNKSGRCMTPHGGSTSNGADIVLWDCDQHEISQRWNEGILYNRHSDKAVAPYGGGSKDGTELTLWSWNPNDYHQYWYANHQ
jgi:hypothetical protein